MASPLYSRRSIRLKGYDYRQTGAYFVTIVTQGRECLFGDVIDGEIQLNSTGKIVQAGWENLPDHYPYLTLDAFVVMPNHMHGIIVITNNDNVGAGLKPAPTTHTKRHPLSEIVRAFKTFSARRIKEHCVMPGVPVWQRNYYEHIVRDEPTLCRIREYIINNSLQWASDRENPLNGTTKDFPFLTDDRWCV